MMWVIILISLTAWVMSRETLRVFYPQDEIETYKLYRELTKDNSDTTDINKILVENEQTHLARNLLDFVFQEGLSFFLMLCFTYPFNLIGIIVRVVHIFRDKEYQKLEDNISKGTVRKYAIISQIIILAFMGVIVWIGLKAGAAN